MLNNTGWLGMPFRQRWPKWLHNLLIRIYWRI